MKKTAFLLAILFVSCCGFSQSLTGLWNGTFTNDSTTLRTDQPFEIALTEYKGKVYGYSRREFIKNDTLYYVLKRVKGKIEGDVCEVTEDEFISHNFPYVDKGVKITYTFHYNKNDSSWSLDGKWRTNQVLKRKTGYYALTGNVEMITEKDISKSKLFPHLTELKLADEVPFYVAYVKQKKAEEEQKNIAAAKSKSENKPKEIASANTQSRKNEPQQKNIVQAGPNKNNENGSAEKEATVPAERTDIAKTVNTISSDQDAGNKQPEAKATGVAKTEINKKDETASVKTEPSTGTAKTGITKTTTENKKPEEKISPKQEPAKQTETKPADITKTEPGAKKEETVVKKDIPATSTPDSNAGEKTGLPGPIAAVNVEKRKSETIQSIEFSSDSLVLALYDNGEIDGDTVSILINGEVVMPKQGLKASAIRKTIYITPAMQDSFTLVLYAENLGLYPPNTGLIIIRDGEESHQVRFSADLQKNVAVVFRRKKK